MSVTDDFLKDLEVKDEDVFGSAEAKVPEKETEEEDEQKAKNRRERRLLEKNQQLREEAIATNARLQALQEAKESQSGTEEADYLKKAERIYGNATPEAKVATDLLKEALKGVAETARREAYEDFQKESSRESEAQHKEDKTVEGIADRVEDEYGIDMSNDADRKGFFTLLEKLSPKDAEGNILEYADPDATAELFISRKEKSNGRAKELASRSMTHSGANQGKAEQSAMEKYLLDNGFI